MMYHAILTSYLIFLTANNVILQGLGSSQCSLAVAPGPCRAYFLRYFYNQTNGTCQSFVYGGCQGNNNNFVSKSNCERACNVTTSAAGTNQTQTSGSTDGAASSNSTSKQNDTCRLPAQTGPCRASLTSFFFNSSRGQCQSFIYGGCLGNANRFQTVQACQAACARNGSGTNTSLKLSNNSDCNKPKVVGRCRAYMPSFFYNTSTGNCEGFVFRGCQGNANRFASKQQCEQKCKRSGTATPCQNQTSVCLQPKEKGPCRGRMRRWFFSPQNQTCQMFYYGGCRGNDNNFESPEDCERQCVPTHGGPTADPGVDPCDQHSSNQSVSSGSPSLSALQPTRDRGLPARAVCLMFFHMFVFWSL